MPGGYNQADVFKPETRNPKLFINFNRHIRADTPAKRAARTLVRFFEDHKVITFLVEFVRDPDRLLRAGFNAELAPLAPFSINNNLSHNKTRKSSFASWPYFILYLRASA